MKTKLLEGAALMAAIMLGATVAQADVDKHIMVTPADLVWTDVGSLPKGAKAAVKRLLQTARVIEGILQHARMD